MKNRLLSVLVGLTAAIASGASLAMPITLTDTTYFTAAGTNSADDYIAHGRGDVNWLSTWDFVKWQHSFTFSPAVDTIVDSKLTLTFFDDRDYWEFGFGYSDSGDWDIGEIDGGDYTYDVDVDGLYDGLYTVKIKSLLGDFGISSSRLSITYEPVGAAAVSEPGTIALMLLGVVGLAAARYRRA